MEEPLHVLIADDLRGQITRGELAVGDSLPSEAELRLRWGGSRGPIRQALATLRADGLIIGGRGKSPVVHRQQLGQPFDSFMSFSRWVHSLGRTPGQRTIEIALRPAKPATARTLGLRVGEPVVELLRLRLLDAEPVMVERSAFVRRYGDLLFTHSPDDGSIYEHLIDQGLQVGSAHHTIDAVPADDADAELLGVTLGSPLLRELRIGRTEDGEPFEYSDDRYRPDRVTFTIDNAVETRPLLDRSWRSGTTTAAPTHDREPDTSESHSNGPHSNERGVRS